MTRANPPRRNAPAPVQEHRSIGESVSGIAGRQLRLAALKALNEQHCGLAGIVPAAKGSILRITIARRFATLALLLALPLPPPFAQANQFRNWSRKRQIHLLVDGKPFLMLGGQIDNRVFVPDEMAKVLPGFKSYYANTVEFPVTWKAHRTQRGSV